MKKITTIFVLMCGFWAMAQNSIKGTLLNENKQPVPSANVILLSLPDSTLVKGAITNEKGIFELFNNSKSKDFALKITHLEYKDKIISVNSSDFGIIFLEKSTQELGEVVVATTRPIMKQQGTKIITDIATSKLQNLPKTEMLLNFLPGVTTSYTGGGYEVFGKGNPIFYINNRRVRDIDEVNQISPKDIENIELETQPGAEFDNSVGAIIRIKLKKKQGDGVSGMFYAEHQFFEKGTEQWIKPSFNFRKGKTDFFANATFDLSNHRIAHSSNDFMVKHSQGRIFFEEMNDYNKKNFNGKIGFSHEFNENHFIGASFQYAHNPMSGRDFAEHKNQVFQNQTLVNEFLANNIRDNKDRKITANAYYEGKLAEKLKLQTDVDYVGLFSDYQSDMIEKNTLTHTQHSIHSLNDAQSHWFGFKTTLTQEFGKIRMNYGTEFSHLFREDAYKNTLLVSPLVENKEWRSSGFLSATYPLGKANIKAGIRYEFADFQYFENKIKSNVKSRLYQNWLPNISVAFPYENTQISVSYQKKIRRPAFYQLNDYAQYENLYLYNSGNPYLMPHLSDEFSVLASYKNLSASVVFTHHHKAFYEDYRPYAPNPNVIEKIIRNYDDYQSLKMVLSAHHTIGRWMPKIIFTGGKQFANGVFERNDFIYHIDLQNNIQLSQKWLMLLYANYISKGSMKNSYNEKPFGGVHLGFAGNFFNNSLTIFAVFQDIFDTFQMYDVFENQYVKRHSYNDNSGMRCFKIGLEYSFNPTNNKYKGQGNSEDRL